MKPFDLPYNFDTDLIDFYKIFFKNDLAGLLHSVYFVPFQQDYFGAKHFYRKGSLTSINSIKLPLYNKLPKDDKEYFKQIVYLNDKIPNVSTLLLQQNDQIMGREKIQKYYDFGIHKFCVGSIEQAKIIKDLDPTCEVTGSITMKIMPDVLTANLQSYLPYFNNFVLWFPYNRDIKLIQKLPINFKYILLINCGCNKRCNGTQHWLASTQEEEDKALQCCPNSKKNDIKDKIYIPPQHLFLFDQYVSYYKLQGREETTQTIIKDVIKFTMPLKDFNLFETQLLLQDYNL